MGDDRAAPGLQFDLADHAANATRPPSEAEVHLVREQRWLPRRHEDTFGPPVPKVGGGPRILIFRVVVALLVLAQDDPDHVVWTGTVVAILVDRTDRVVRRGGHGLHRTDGLVVVEQAGEWANGRHGTFIERNEVTRECWAP